MSEPRSQLLLVQIPPPADAAYLDTVAPVVARHGGELLAAVRAGVVERLEPGTPERGLLFARFATRAAVERFWHAADHAAALASLADVPDACAFVVDGLPEAGLPDALQIPTTASVTPPSGRGPRHYMVIQGVVTDQSRIDAYRDMILPMIKAEGGYYIAFDPAGGHTCLLGRSEHRVTVVSRWPDHAAGHAFWDSDKYQNEAIPTRTGGGVYTVHFFEGVSG